MVFTFMVDPFFEKRSSTNLDHNNKRHKLIYDFLIDLAILLVNCLQKCEP